MVLGEHVDLRLERTLGGLRPKEVEFLLELKEKGKTFEDYVSLHGINIVKLSNLELIKIWWSPKEGQRAFAITILGKEFLRDL